MSICVKYALICVEYALNVNLYSVRLHSGLPFLPATSLCVVCILCPHPLSLPRQSVLCTCLTSISVEYFFTSVCVEYIYILPPLSATPVCIVYVSNASQCRVCLRVNLRRFSLYVHLHSGLSSLPATSFCVE